MLEKITKNKPLLIGGGLLFIVIVVLASRGGGGGTTVVSSGSNPADAQLQLAAMEIQAQQNAAQMQLALGSQQSQANIAMAQLQAGVEQYRIENENARAYAEINASQRLAELDLSTNERITMRSIESELSLARWQMDTTYNMQVAQQAFQLDYAENASQSNERIQAMQAQLVNNQVTANRDIAMANINANTAQTVIMTNAQADMLNSNLSFQSSLAATNANTQVRLAEIEAMETLELQRSNNRTKNSQSALGIVSKIALPLLSIFSDPRLKENVIFVGRTSEGLGVYDYNYIGSDANYTGFMADEVAAIAPYALGPVIDGYATIMPELLNAA